MGFSLKPTSSCFMFISISISVFFQLHLFILVHGQCLKTQQSSLLLLKQSLIFNHTRSSKLVSWDSETDCCSWRGVTCNNVGYVIGLDLSNEFISSEIDSSSSLFDLHQLRSLSLAENSFNFTPIPNAIGKLIRLRYLNLSNAGFAGQIPAEISSLTELISLDLSSPYSEDPTLKLGDPNLLALVQNLTRLTQLDLTRVNISASGHEWCPALSSSLPNLTVLKLAWCFLSGPIDPSLSNLKFLSVIRLDGNDLSTHVPDFFVNFANLKSLSLHDCGLHGTFPYKIFQLPTLQEIDISGNSQLQGFLPEFHGSGSLESMVLDGTNFSGTLPNSIGRLKMLSTLELSGCSFKGSVPESITNLTNLVFLDLSDNQFNGSIPSFTMFKYVTYIGLYSNYFTGNITSTSWGKLLSLEALDLGSNSLNGFIPLSLFSLPSMRSIRLSNNQFSGQLNDFSAAPSCQLYDLDLSKNKLEGPIPMSVFELCGLEALDLSSNNFNGNIKLSTIFQKLGNLSQLNLSFNNLSVSDDSQSPGHFRLPQLDNLYLASCKLTTFPSFLRNQTFLSRLDLSDNQIGGEIPKWIWKLTAIVDLNLSCNFFTKMEGPFLNSPFLNIMDLHSNLLEGDLPVFESNPYYIDYSHNYFSSVIPPEFGFDSSTFISLSNNNLQGSIPESVCNSPYLNVLDLSYNNLSGRLPHCLFAMKEINLGVLNLRRNRFNGTVADVFPADCGLQTLNLNGNLLHGKLPKSLANCKMLEVLDIGNNQVNDSFPFWLSHIRSLRVLVLRSNKFHGPIYCPEAEKNNSSWPMLKIVDLASNYFSGGLPDGCLAMWKALTVDETEDQSMFKLLQFEIDPDSQWYYRDAITVTSKGLELQMTKILTIFAAFDLSCNSFQGPIPEVVGSFKALYALNLSHNAMTGTIPEFVGNLRRLESLDLSSNNLNGEIPEQLANLNFLSFLNLSNNKLVGMIPKGTQLQSFSEASFANNTALCGPPLKDKCGFDGQPPSSFPLVRHNHSNSGSGHVNWNLIVPQLGYVFGLGLVILPQLVSRKFRIWYYGFIDRLLFRLSTMLSKKN